MMFLRYFIPTMAFCLFIQIAEAQNAKVSALDRADCLFQAQDYNKLISFIDELSEKEITTELLFLKAKALLRKKDFLQASKIFEKLLSETNNKKIKQKCYFYLAECKTFDEKFEEALSLISNAGEISSGNMQQHKIIELESRIKKAVEFYKIQEAKISNQQNFNTINNEVYPVWGTSDSVIYFATDRESKDNYDIYVGTQIEKKCKKVESDINSSQSEYCTDITPDNQEMILVTKERTFSEIYYSVKDKNKWTAPENSGFLVNTVKYNETFASISPDLSVIFFESDRTGSKGGTDIYAAKKLPDNSWGKPYNISEKINTKYNEKSPYYHAASRMLYFSSDNPKKGIGGYDIYKCKINQDGTVGIPELLPFPINSTGDDFSFRLHASGEYAYLSSRRAGGKGQQDLYKIEFKQAIELFDIFSGNISVEDSIVPTYVKIDVYERDKLYGTYRPNAYNGKYVLVLQQNKEYKATYHSPGYHPVEKTISTHEKNAKINKIEKVQLLPYLNKLYLNDTTHIQTITEQIAVKNKKYPKASIVIENLAENKQAYNKVIEALRQAGINENNITDKIVSETDIVLIITTKQ